MKALIVFVLLVLLYIITMLILYKPVIDIIKSKNNIYTILLWYNYYTSTTIERRYTVLFKTRFKV